MLVCPRPARHGPRRYCSPSPPRGRTSGDMPPRTRSRRRRHDDCAPACSEQISLSARVGARATKAISALLAARLARPSACARNPSPRGTHIACVASAAPGRARFPQRPTNTSRASCCRSHTSPGPGPVSAGPRAERCSVGPAAGRAQGVRGMFIRARRCASTGIYNPDRFLDAQTTGRAPHHRLF